MVSFPNTITSMEQKYSLNIMPCSFYLQLILYTWFKETNPSMEIGFSTFEKLKPWFVKQLAEFNSCYFRHHAQMLELKDALNAM